MADITLKTEKRRTSVPAHVITRAVEKAYAENRNGKNGQLSGDHHSGKYSSNTAATKSRKKK